MPSRRPAARPPTALVVRLPSQDLTAARDFYARDLGLTPTYDAPARVVFRIGGARLELFQHDGPRSSGGDACLTLRCDDPEALSKRLRSLGVEVEALGGGSDPSGFRVRDPDGRWLTLAASASGAEAQ